jgi:polysaccharide chain length determinant protein (PEP-CTERM system associated)
MQAMVLRMMEEMRGGWRFRTQALVAAWAICLLGWLAVLAMPNIYEASARVYLDTQGALRPLLKGLAVEPNIESELDMVRQAILSGPNLETIARDAGVNLSAASTKNREAALALFKQRITVERDSRSASSDGVYRIAYESTNRGQSLSVVKKLLESLVEGTLGNSRSGQEDAQRFLQSQIADYEQRLSAAEDRLATFKQQNVGKMPTDNGDYFKRLQTELSGLQDSQAALSLASARKDELEKQLTGEEPYIFGIDSTTANSQNGNAAGGDVAVRIQELEKRREELLLRFTPKHPEIVALDNTLLELHGRQDAELKRVRAGDRATGDLASSLKSNPVYQGLQVQAKQAAVQVAELRRDVALRQGRVGALQRLVTSVPEVEAELARLNRDYDATRSQYQELLKRYETAKLSNDVDKTGTVKFQVIEPPAVPLTPISPKRGILLSGILFAGLAAGIALAYLLNLLRPVFFSWRPLGTVVGLPVIGCVRRFADQATGATARRQLVLLSMASAALLMVFTLILVGSDQGVHLVERLTRGTGMP